MRKQSIQEKKAHLQEQLAKIEAEENKELDLKLKAIGRTIFQQMGKDPSFKQQITEILAQHVKNKADRKLLNLEKLELAK